MNINERKWRNFKFFVIMISFQYVLQHIQIT